MTVAPISLHRPGGNGTGTALRDSTVTIAAAVVLCAWMSQYARTTPVSGAAAMPLSPDTALVIEILEDLAAKLIGIIPAERRGRAMLDLVSRAFDGDPVEPGAWARLESFDKMVRLMVGALAKCAVGKMRTEEITSRLDSGKLGSARFAAPAEGLYLVRVRY